MIIFWCEFIYCCCCFSIDSCDVCLPQITALEFDYNKFYFNQSIKKIYWKESRDCNSPVEYELNNWSKNLYTVVLNETGFSLSSKNLSEGESHYIYIIAKSNGSQCSMSNAALNILSNGMLSIN